MMKVKTLVGGIAIASALFLVAPMNVRATEQVGGESAVESVTQNDDLTQKVENLLQLLGEANTFTDADGRYADVKKIVTEGEFDEAQRNIYLGEIEARYEATLERLSPVIDEDLGPVRRATDDETEMESQMSSQLLDEDVPLADKDSKVFKTSFQSSEHNDAARIAIMVLFAITCVAIVVTLILKGKRNGQ